MGSLPEKSGHVKVCYVKIPHGFQTLQQGFTDLESFCVLNLLRFSFKLQQVFVPHTGLCTLWSATVFKEYHS